MNLSNNKNIIKFTIVLKKRRKNKYELKNIKDILEDYYKKPLDEILEQNEIQK